MPYNPFSVISIDLSILFTDLLNLYKFSVLIDLPVQRRSTILYFADRHEVQMQNAETRDTTLLTDNDVTSCITVPKVTENGSYFKARFPWPVLGSASQIFTACVIGHNLQCASAVILYTPLEGQQREDAKQQFIGNYRMCEYVNEVVVDAGTGRVQCDYRCSCGEDVCSAVYIFASNKNGEENQEICGLSFI